MTTTITISAGAHALLTHVARNIAPAVVAAKQVQGVFSVDIPIDEFGAIADEDRTDGDARGILFRAGIARNRLYTKFEQCDDIRIYHISVDFRFTPKNGSVLLQMSELMLERGRAYNLSRQHVRYLLDTDGAYLKDRFIECGKLARGPKCTVPLVITAQHVKVNEPMPVDEIESMVRDWLNENGLRGKNYTIDRDSDPWTFTFDLPIAVGKSRNKATTDESKEQPGGA